MYIEKISLQLETWCPNDFYNKISVWYVTSMKCDTYLLIAAAVILWFKDGIQCQAQLRCGCQRSVRFNSNVSQLYQMSCSLWKLCPSASLPRKNPVQTREIFYPLDGKLWQISVFNSRAIKNLPFRSCRVSWMSKSYSEVVKCGSAGAAASRNRRRRCLAQEVDRQKWNFLILNIDMWNCE